MAFTRVGVIRFLAALGFGTGARAGPGGSRFLEACMEEEGGSKAPGITISDSENGSGTKLELLRFLLFVFLFVFFCFFVHFLQNWHEQ